MTDLTVANTILAQLGGRRFLAMTGAKDIVGGEASLQFKLPRGFAKNKATHARVTLDASDTYTLAFFKWNARALDMATLSSESGIYAEDLRRFFTEATGLDCVM